MKQDIQKDIEGMETIGYVLMIDGEEVETANGRLVYKSSIEATRDMIAKGLLNAKIVPLKDVADVADGT